MSKSKTIRLRSFESIPVSIQSIVLSRPDRIGDVVVSTSCLRALRERFPQARLYWLGQAPLACLFHEHPALTEYWNYPEEQEEQGQAELSKMFERADIECVVHLEADRVVEQAASSVGVQYRIGFDLLGKEHLTHGLPHTKKQGLIHEGAYCFQLLDYLGVEQPAVLKPWIQVSPASLEAAQRILNQNKMSSRYAVFHLSAHGTKARIPTEIMASIAQWLIVHQDCMLVLVGGRPNEPEEIAFLQALDSYVAKVVNLCGKTKLDETAWIMQQAIVTVTRDSGPAHLSAAMNAPTFTLFAEPSPSKCATRWRPLGEHSYFIENDIRKHWWESDERFAKRNAAKFDEISIMNELQRVLANTQ